MKDEKLPRLFLPYELGGSGYYEGVARILNQLLPHSFYKAKSKEAWLASHLPLIGYSELKAPPCYFSFFLVAPCRPSSFRFFAQMCRSILANKRHNLFLQFSTEFAMPDLGPEFYIAGEVAIRIENADDMAHIAKVLPSFESEVRFGLVSSNRATRLLEMRGISPDEKRSFLQDELLRLINRFPTIFDPGLYEEMQRLFVVAGNLFIEKRSIAVLRRIISSIFLFRKALMLSLEAFPDKREIYVKTLRRHENGEILGIVIGATLHSNHEVLEERHIFHAIQSILSLTTPVKDSFIALPPTSESFRLFYIEVKHDEARSFSLNEISHLKKGLTSALKQRIEKRVSLVFMPENEEEVLRHILALADQIRHIRDLPQAVIDFQAQTEEELCFLVIIARAARIDETSLAKIFTRSSHTVSFSHRKTRKIAPFRKNYVKEVSVFTAKVPKELFLRSDQAIDFNKARKTISINLKERLFDFRDYNGGMLSKEQELLLALKNELKKDLVNDLRSQDTHEIEKADNGFILENFFYSLTPSVMRSVLPPEPLAKLFLMLVDAEKAGLKGKAPFASHYKMDGDFLLFVLLSNQLKVCQEVHNHIQRLILPHLQMATFLIQSSTEYPVFGLLSRNTSGNERITIERAIKSVITEFDHFEN